MTTVEIGKSFLVANGHAGYAESGKDIVCAAVSTLVQTMAECLQKEQDEGGITNVSLSLLPGDVKIEWQGEAKCLPVIETGFELLCNTYPEYVKARK